MTTKNEQQCGVCGGTEFGFEEGDTFRWMRVGCYDCELFLDVRKADTAATVHEKPNRSTAIERYAEHTKSLAMQELKTK